MNRLLKALLILLVSSLLAVQQDNVFAEAASPFAIPPKYQYAAPFSNGLAVIAMDGQLGLINKEGKEIVRPFYDQMIDVKGRSVEVDDNFDNEYWISTYMTANVELDVEMNNIGNPANLFSDGLALVVKSDKYGYIDRKGYEVIKPQYLYAEPFQDGLAVVLTEEGYGFIDTTGKIVISPEYAGTFMFQEDVVLMLTQDDETILFNRKGKEIAVFNAELELSPYQEGLALVYDRSKERYGYANKKGKLVIEPIYEQAAFFSEGLALVQREDRIFYVNAKGQEIIELKDSSYYKDSGNIWQTHSTVEPINSHYNDKILSNMDQFAFKEGLALVIQAGKYGYINTKGNDVVVPQYDQASPYRNGLAQIIVDDKYGYLNTKGEIAVEPQYDYAFQYEDGMIRVVKDDKAGFMDAKGKLIAEPQYDETYFNDYLPFINNFRIVTIEGKYGYLDKSGNEVVKPQYDNVAPFFTDGLAAVKSHGRIGYIDETGQEIIRPYYDEPTLPFFSEGIAVVKIDDHFGMIDKNDVPVLPIQEVYEDLYPVTDGMSAVQVDGLWGYIASPIANGGSTNKYMIFALVGVVAVVVTAGWFVLESRKKKKSIVA